MIFLGAQASTNSSKINLDLESLINVYNFQSENVHAPHSPN
jgi:hypothetical protein